MNQIISTGKKISGILMLVSLVAISACEEDNPITTDFEASDTVVLAGTEIVFTDLSIGGSVKWEWVFDGGSPVSSDVNSPTVIYSEPGTYDVTLTTTNADNNKDCKHKAGYITVLDRIAANFSVSNAYIEAGSEVTFTDLSTGNPSSWQWSFPGGNPSSSTEPNPVVKYETEGEYDITLVTSNDLSSDNTTKVKTIVVRRAVSHYKLDGNANDSGPLKLEGIIHGATLTTDRNHVANAAYRFDGIDDFIEMPFNSLAKDLPLSISFWVEFDELNSNILDIDYVHNQTSGISFNIGQANETLFRLGTNIGAGGAVNPSTRKTFVTNNILEEDHWYHVVSVIENQTTVKTYINGILTTGFYTGSGTSYFHSGSHGTLGKTGNPSDLFNGKLDDFRIYNKVLSAQEVMSIYSE